MILKNHSRSSCGLVLSILGVLVAGLAFPAHAGWVSEDTSSVFWLTEGFGKIVISSGDTLWSFVGGRGVYRSINGTTWTAAAPDFDWDGFSGFAGACHEGGLFFLDGQRSRVYSSDDGSVWQYDGTLNYYDDLCCSQSLVSARAVSFQNALWVLDGAVNIDNYYEGGESFSGTFPLNEVLRFRTSARGGDAKVGELVTYAAWPARYQHGAVVFDNKMWIIGGDLSNTNEPYAPANDVWYSEDGTTWVQALANAPWPARARHACIVYQNQIWVLGGITAEGPANDVWRSANGIDWTLLAEHAPWSPRADHECVVFQDKLWMYYGYSWPEKYGDVWTFSPEAGEGEGASEGGGEGVAEGEGEGVPVDQCHTADQDQNLRVNLVEILRVIQFYNLGDFHCAIPPESTEDGYAPGPGDTSCTPHDSDYAPQDWRIGLSELLRLIQFFNTGGYTYCPESGTEDGFCPAGQ